MGFAYLRSTEALSLRHEDLVEAPIPDSNDTEISLRLGVAERGETNKKLGIIKELGAIIRTRRQFFDAASSARIQDSECSRYARMLFVAAWRDAGKKLGVDLGPPHSLRHSGPAHDAWSNYRSIFQIQRRGRWSSERSVLRYSKTHSLVEQRAKVPKALLEKGARILSARAPRPTQARD